MQNINKVNRSNDKINDKLINSDSISNPLGYSVIHEYRQEDLSNFSSFSSNKNLLHNKQNHIWIPDSSITHCQRCNVEFTVWLRKHHCRCCGNIFCFDCTPFRKKIPKNLKENSNDSSLLSSSYYNLSGSSPFGISNIQNAVNVVNSNALQRLCYSCNDQIDLLASLDTLIDVFSLVVPDIFTLTKMSQVCHLWYNLVQFFLGKIRNIQYKPINQSFSILEKKLLWNNRLHFIGHSHYTILLIKSLDYDSFQYRNTQHNEFIKFLNLIEKKSSNYKPIINCIHLLCTKNCCNILKPYHAIVISDFCCRTSVCQELHDFSLKILQKINNDELFYYLPFLVDKLIYHRVDSSFSWGNFLIERSMTNPDIALELYWNLIYKEKETRHAIYNFYLNKFLSTINEQIILLVNKSFAFVKFLENIPKTQDIIEIKNYFRKNSIQNCVIPMESSLKIEDVILTQMHIKNSFTAPLLIPLICSINKDMILSNDNNDKNYKINQNNQTINYKILYKFENIRQDYLILKVIRLMKYLLHTYENIDIEIVDYHVCPLTDQTGIIQIVPDCKTAYEIKEKMKFTIWNYIVEHNPHVTVENLRQRFVKSCAAYCIITYLLGVGDRHLDNIMITKEGKLFHIDYGFVLGTDPKPLSQPKIRITQDMIDALGGYQSVYYTEFLKLCNRIYQGLRGHLNLFICLLAMLCQDDKEKYNKLVELLTSRFMPGETQKTAIVQLESEILRSTQQNLGEVIVDFFHYHKKENTISNVLTNTASATHNVISSTATISKKVGGYVGNTINNWWQPKN